jgi:MYXO-CTERM domain-containing protein
MSQTMLQTVMWIATFAVLVLFLQRRRRRRSNF